MAFGFGSHDEEPKDPKLIAAEELVKIRLLIEKIVADVERMKFDVDKIARKVG